MRAARNEREAVKGRKRRAAKQALLVAGRADPAPSLLGAYLAKSK